MVKIITQKNQTYYQCPECGLLYEEKEWAEKCESWCKNYKSCNLEIIKNAVKDFSQEENIE